MLSAADRVLLDRYYAGLCDERESVCARQLIESDRRERLFAEAVRMELAEDEALPSRDEVHARFELFRAQVIGTEPGAGLGPPGGHRAARHPRLVTNQETSARNHRRVFPVTWYATIIGVVASAALVLLVSWYSVSRAGREPASVTTYTTANGKQASITLPDGSHVTLNVASRLEVPTDFGRGTRTLRLTGEASFGVTHTNRMPFTVVAGTTTTRVLGTTFAVRRYNGDTTTIVAVRDGKVVVRAFERTTVLAANQQITLDPSGRGVVSPSTPARFSFETGVLTLDGVTLKDAVPELDRWYDVDLRIADPIVANTRIQASLAAGSRADLMTMLRITLDVRVARQGRVLTIYPK